MFPELKSEIKKIYTIRSTYVITGLAFLLVLFYAFYIVGFKANPPDLLTSHYLSDQIYGADNTVAIFGAMIAILLISNEYRYNTIMYTLTISNNRNKVLLAKVITILGYSVLFTLIISVLAPLITSLGIHVHHLTLAHQAFDFSSIIWKVFFYGIAYALLGLLFGVLLRNVVSAIVALFLIPATIEPLLGLLLKTNKIYLPFNSLFNVVNIGGGDRSARLAGSNVSPAKSALVFLIYFLVGWIVGWILFLRKDANKA